MSPERLTRKDAAYVARLARIDLNEEQLDLYARQLAAVLDYAAELSALDTSGIEPMSRPLPLENVMREDEVAPSLDRGEVLSQAPAVEDRRFAVPPILDTEP